MIENELATGEGCSVLVVARRPGRRAVDADQRAVSAGWSVPQWMKDRVAEIARQRTPPVDASVVAREFVERGLRDLDVRERLTSGESGQ